MFEFTFHKNYDKNIFFICLMFFMWGIASSMAFTLLPLFIVDNLHGGYKSFGLIEGSVIFLSFVSKLLAGVFVDIFKKKMPMLRAGTILTVITKGCLAFSNSVTSVFIAKGIDRFVRGLRLVPSDAILADLSEKRGFVFSLKHAMNIAGSLIGSIITSLLIILFGNNYRAILILSVLPAVAAYLILKLKVTYEKDTNISSEPRSKWYLKDIKDFSAEYWYFIILISILMFARFSEGFITLRAKAVLPDDVHIFPIFMGIYEICCVLISIPICKISDRVNKKLILLYGSLVLVAADIMAIVACNDVTTILIYIGGGIHMGVTQGVIMSAIAENSPKRMIGTAFAIYYAIDGVFLFLSNYLAGISYDVTAYFGIDGSKGPFIQGVIAAAATCYYAFFLLKREKKATIIA